MAAHRAIDHEGEAAREVERACQEPVPRLEDDGEAPIAAALAVFDAVLQRGGVVRAAVAAGRARRVAGRRGQRGGQRARKSGYCPRSTRPPAALARAPVDDAESESESRSRSCCGARQSFAIARTGSLLPLLAPPGPPGAGSRRADYSPLFHICPWCSPALDSELHPFRGSASTPLGAPGYERTDDYTLPATQRLGFAE